MEREALKLALDVLIEMSPSGPTGSDIWQKQMSAITTIAKALAQPVQREWVGLTKEEVRQCGFAVPFDGAQDWALRFYKAIEAKLKEKNT
jgi:hypothetical protein